MTEQPIRDPLAPQRALTHEERASLAEQPDWLNRLLAEQIEAELLLAVTPSVTGEPIP